MTGWPTFSIVIPVYNRAALVRRAIDSCLAQTPADAFEVVVVDDGSTDGSAEAVAAIGDPRVRVVVQPVNRGMCPARNLGADHSRGEWVVCLDSDDELLPGALEGMLSAVRAAGDRIDGIRFTCRLDDGTLSPSPPLTGEVWDYPAYIAWSERAVLRGREETLPCVRRRTFDTARYTDSRGDESLYHLDFAAAFLTLASSHVVRGYHSDAPNQITRPDTARALKVAADQARVYEELLARHGAALARSAPGLLAAYTRGCATRRFLAGDRIGGVRAVMHLLPSHIASTETWAVLTFGILGPRALAWAQAVRARRRRRALTSVSRA